MILVKITKFHTFSLKSAPGRPPARNLCSAQGILMVLDGILGFSDFLGKIMEIEIFIHFS